VTRFPKKNEMANWNQKKEQFYGLDNGQEIVKEE
jgi:hypothetical protein